MNVGVATQKRRPARRLGTEHSSIDAVCAALSIWQSPHQHASASPQGYWAAGRRGLQIVSRLLTCPGGVELLHGRPVQASPVAQLGQGEIASGLMSSEFGVYACRHENDNEHLFLNHAGEE